MPFLPGAFSAIAAGFAAVKATAFGSALLQLAVSAGLSLLSQALAPRPTQPGQRIDGTRHGEDVPQSFPIGRCLTGGHLEYHGSFGEADGTPNAYYIRVISVSDVPGVTLRRIAMGDAWSDLDATAHPEFGLPLLRYRKDGIDHAWVKWLDGSQTAADPFLVDRFGADPDQPWTAQHVGTGIAYAIVTLRFNRELFQGVPAVAFEVNGIPLYDPRLDSSVGGSGPQRWTNRATWAASDNPAVQIYNLARGIALPDGSIYGGEVPAADLPLANVFAAANVCDTLKGSRRQYRAGIEALVSEEPATLIETLLRAGLGQIAENGGVFRLRFGAPAPASLFITDGDISISDPQGFTPFPGLQGTANAISVTYREPGSLWQSKGAPPVLDPALEAEDGGRRLMASLSLDAVFNRRQAMQVARGYIKDERRFRTHQIVLPADAQVLEALDSISWTSVRNGYSAKLFEVTGCTYLPGLLFVALSLRERDPNDYDWSTDQELPDPPTLQPATYAPRAITGFFVEATTVRDGAGQDRRPALRLRWNPAASADLTQLRWQVQLHPGTDADILRGVAPIRDGAQLVAEGILPGQTYRCRVRPQTSKGRVWSNWAQVTVPDVRLSTADLGPSVTQIIANAQDAADAANARLDADLADADRRVELALLQAAQNSNDRLTLRRELYRVEQRAGDAQAEVRAEAVVRVAEDEALAAQINTVSASLGQTNATVSQQSVAIATLDGYASATYSLRLTGAGASARFEMVASNNPSGPASAVKIAAQNIRLDGNVEVTGDFLAQSVFASNAWITNAMIQNGAITNAKISGVIQSNNYVAGSAGWRIDKGGAAEFNSLVVRDDMLAEGAVLRKAFLRRYSNLSMPVGSGSPAVVSSNVTTFRPAPYIVDPASPLGGGSFAWLLNPVVVTISFLYTASAPCLVVFQLQRRGIGGTTWTTQQGDMRTALLQGNGTASIMTPFEDVRPFTTSLPVANREYRLRGYIVTTGVTVSISDVTAVMEQMSK